jgi:exonuclease SbcD
MRVVHAADLHLGFRQYQRATSTGLNQREADVAATFTAAIDQIIAIAPDLIVIAGDIFHVVRPSNSAIVFAFNEFSRLVRELPRTPIVLVAGNHDTPRTAETGGILQLFMPLGIHVVDKQPRRLNFPNLDLSVLAVPDAGFARPALEPDPSARFNVMVLHGEAQGMLTGAAARDRAAVEIPLDQMNPGAWDYVALGHYHVYREIAPNTFYSGSIDYTSSNPWGEMQEERQLGLSGKGFAERDLVTGRQTFHALPNSRELVDLPTIDGADCSADEIDELLKHAVDYADGPIDDKVVRLVVRNVSREIARDLDQKAIRDYKRRALNFNLDIRRPDAIRMQSGIVRNRTQSVDSMVMEILSGRFQLAADVDRAAFLERASDVLAEVEGRKADPARPEANAA